MGNRFIRHSLFGLCWVFIHFSHGQTEDIRSTHSAKVSSIIDALTLDEKISLLVNDNVGVERLNIPPYNWWNEALHGVARSAKATVFPQAIGMAATFDQQMMYKVGTAISTEARAINNDLKRKSKDQSHYTGLTFWSPNVNIFRDPRWGRGQETFGEDPYLTGAFAAAFIEGMRGDDEQYIRAATCAKHFAVHSGPEVLRHGFNAQATKRDMEETYLPAFKRSVDAGVNGIMCAYNRTNDVPCCGSNELLTEILFDRWGFDGYLVSDCGAIEDFHEGHGFTQSESESMALALTNGLTLECGETFVNLKEEVIQGTISEEQLDHALFKNLTVLEELGFFSQDEEHPYSAIFPEDIEDNRELSLEAAQKSIVLLQNNHQALPLNPESDYLFLTGPLMDRVLPLLGNYYGLNDRMTTLLEGIMGTLSPTTRVEYWPGSIVKGPTEELNTWFTDKSKTADATIVALGTTVLMESEQGETIVSDHKGDNLEMKLPDNQINLLKQLGESDKPVIAVVFAGSPLDLTEVVPYADAIVYAWFPGEAGGEAVADVLFGKVNPSGKLPVSFPMDASELPAFDDYSMQGRTYKYAENLRYPFGWGLTYNELEYRDLEIKQEGEKITLSMEVKNPSDDVVSDVAQLYVSMQDKEAYLPKAELKWFERIELMPNSEQIIQFSLEQKDLTYIDFEGISQLFDGNLKLYFGNASPISPDRSLDNTHVLSDELFIKAKKDH